MGERPSHAAGTFSWADLGTSDADGAKVFYGGLLGWEFEDMPIPDSPPYSMATIGGRPGAALYGKRDEQAPPAWPSSGPGEEADAPAARAAELGGTVISEPFDVMEAGRMAVLQDPTGAVFAVWHPRASIGAQLVNEAGAMCLNQLNTSDPDAAQSFYGSLFGWTFQGVESAGQSYWGITNGERLNGGMMESTPSNWLAYFTSTDVDVSAAKVADLGGKVIVPPSPVPGGRIAGPSDPPGAGFAPLEGRIGDSPRRAPRPPAGVGSPPSRGARMVTLVKHKAVLAIAVLMLALLPVGARAATATITSDPLTVTADDMGAVQVKFTGSDTAEFY